MRIFLCFFALFLSIQCVFAAGVASGKLISQAYSKSGNIFYTQNDGRIVRATDSGKDSSPVLSSDGTMIAFVRIGNRISPSGCRDFADTPTKYGNQIWLYELGAKKERLLVENNFQCDKPEKKIVDPSGLQFSPDNKTLYFIASAWVTSGALHAVNVDGSNQHYVIPASSVEVVPRGQYKGYLIVQQHRYFVGGGSYDWLWLYTPQGHEEGPLGEDVTQDQQEYLEMEVA